jgi:PhnB protein
MVTPENKDKVMHAAFKVGDTTILASDGRCTGSPTFQGISLTLNAKNEGEANRLFGALADGGQVQMPLAKTFFSPSFGMLADRFGVNWMVVAGQ